jgi:hypothetical protein
MAVPRALASIALLINLAAAVSALQNPEMDSLLLIGSDAGEERSSFQRRSRRL